MISVIVPIYNVEEYLPQCIRSISSQTYTELEIILVDDGSTDSGGALCDAYARQDARIKVIHKENGGLVSARKAGVNAAGGEYITFVDGDDWIAQDAYSRIMEHGGGADIIAFACLEEYGDYQCVRKNSVREGLYVSEGEKRRLYQTMFMDNHFYQFGIMPSLWSKLIRKDIIVRNQNKVSDCISYGEDVACTFPCLLDAGTICVTNLPLYHYRQRQDSIVKGSAKVPRCNFINLYSLLQAKFRAAVLHGKPLLVQLHFYMWFALLAKAYGDAGTDMVLFPFLKVTAKSSVAVYGAGAFGRSVKAYCDSQQDISVTGWVDLHYKTYRKQGFGVQGVEELQNIAFDTLIIAILNEPLAVRIKDELIRTGIPEECIDWVRQDILEAAPLPDWVRAE